MRISMLLFAFLFVSQILVAQYGHTDILKGLNGDVLFEKLLENYKTSYTMPYGMARDTLYSKIDIQENNVLECVYTGFKINLDLSQDPTADAFSKGINAEHSYPQSKGAENGLGKSDLHHLYPTREGVNSDRGSNPYGESPDNETDNWYILDKKSSVIPTSNIDGYSEINYGNTLTVFEPRESMKGNIARGLFYFYTMYRNEAEAADPEFFGLQKETLCNWHYQDVVDEREWNRSQMIGSYQEGKANPFVLDCSLAARLYCDQISTECELLTATQNINTTHGVSVGDPFPNPSIGLVKLPISSSTKVNLIIRVLDVQGNLFYTKVQQVLPYQSFVLNLELPERVGIYFIEIIGARNENIFKKIIKI